MRSRFRTYAASVTTNLPVAAIALVLLLTGCGRQEAAVPGATDPERMVLTRSPNSTGAIWAITQDGRGIGFGRSAAKPYVSLACKLSSAQKPRLTVIRHARSQPGAKALFAVLGNGIAARFKVDGALAEGEGWRWEATLPASAGQFDVFTGPRDIEATLPGAGMIVFPASNLPREFIEWCRRNGKELPKPEGEEVSSPPPG